MQSDSNILQIDNLSRYFGGLAAVNDCKKKKKKPDYLHPLLENILKPTYGVIIYQEQVMQIAQKLSLITKILPMFLPMNYFLKDYLELFRLHMNFQI